MFTKMKSIGTNPRAEESFTAESSKEYFSTISALPMIWIFHVLHYFPFVMDSVVVGLRNYFKIYNPIVQLVSIFMVNTLFRPTKKFSPKKLFHYISMLHNIFLVYVNTIIPIIINTSHSIFISIKRKSSMVKNSSVMFITISLGNLFSITRFNGAFPREV